jgi:hypothetical protein
MMKSPRPFAIVLVALGPFSVPFGVSSALAQDVGNSGAGGGGSGGAGAPATGTTVTSQTYYYPGGVAPTPPGKPLGGGNVTGSSSMPKVGTRRTTSISRRAAEARVRSMVGPTATAWWATEAAPFASAATGRGGAARCPMRTS